MTVTKKPFPKRANGIPLITIEYNSVSMLFQQDSVVLSTVIKNPFNTTERYKNPKYHSKKHSDTIQIPLAIIPLRTIQVPLKYH